MRLNSVAIYDLWEPRQDKAFKAAAKQKTSSTTIFRHLAGALGDGYFKVRIFVPPPTWGERMARYSVTDIDLGQVQQLGRALNVVD